MSKVLHALLHVLGFAVSIGAVATNIVPAPYQPLVVALVSAGQAGLAIYNHQSAAVKNGN